MESNTTKDLPPFQVTSRTPGKEKVRIGQAIALLTESVMSNVVEFESAIETSEKLEHFLADNERYANPRQLSKISSPNALKAWAAERLPALGISYGFSNRVTKDVAQHNLDEQASLRIVQFADDLVMVSRFCRAVEELNIEADVHSHGIEFRFTIKGDSLGPRFDQTEAESFDQLLMDRSKDGSFRNRIFAVDGKIEAQSILFRKKVRLGFSPVF